MWWAWVDRDAGAILSDEKLQAAQKIGGYATARLASKRSNIIQSLLVRAHDQLLWHNHHHTTAATPVGNHNRNRNRTHTTTTTVATIATMPSTRAHEWPCCSPLPLTPAAFPICLGALRGAAEQAMQKAQEGLQDALGDIGVDKEVLPAWVLSRLYSRGLVSFS